MNKAIANKILVVVLHACGWALLFTLPFRFLTRSMPPERKRETLERFPPPEHQLESCSVRSHDDQSRIIVIKWPAVYFLLFEYVHFSA